MCADGPASATDIAEDFNLSGRGKSRPFSLRSVGPRPVRLKVECTKPVWIWQDNCFICIERNRYLLFSTAHGLQFVLPNPTTPALTRETGLVHQTILFGRWWWKLCTSSL